MTQQETEDLRRGPEVDAESAFRRVLERQGEIAARAIARGENWERALDEASLTPGPFRSLAEAVIPLFAQATYDELTDE